MLPPHDIILKRMYVVQNYKHYLVVFDYESHWAICPMESSLCHDSVVSFEWLWWDCLTSIPPQKAEHFKNCSLDPQTIACLLGHYKIKTTLTNDWLLIYFLNTWLIDQTSWLIWSSSLNATAILLNIKTQTIFPLQQIYIAKTCPWINLFFLLCCSRILNVSYLVVPD